MSPIVSFVLGLLIGWLVEWIIDWVYWRRRAQPAPELTAQANPRQAELEAALAAARQENRSLRERIGQLEAQQAELAQRAQAAIPVAPPDDLEEINGIGPVIAGKLNALGIHTFEDLAAQTPEFLRANLGDSIQRLADEESLIEQARQFAARQRGQGASLP